MTDVYFQTPADPQGFSVQLTDQTSRKFDFSALDYDTALRSFVEYVKTYFPDIFNDFVASNGVMMLAELIASVTARLSLRADMIADDAFISTARSEAAVVNHLALINQRFKRQTPATVDVEISINQPTVTDIQIDSGLKFSLNGPDGSSITYEVYKSPLDFTNKIVIPANKRGVIAYGIEGSTVEPVSFVSSGGANQQYIITDTNILEQPIYVTIISGSSRDSWKVIYDPIERYSSTDKVVEVVFYDTSAVFKFGDDINGVAPLSGQTIEIMYRVGGGIRGRIGVGQIDSSLPITPLPPANASVSVRFRNITPSMGGTDRETIEQAKKRAPRDFSIHNSITTESDYAQASISYSHPVFGTVSKAVAAVRTSLNANRIEIYALAVGNDDRPVAPSAGLKYGLKTYIDSINVATDDVVIYDGFMKPIDINANIVVSINSDANIVKSNVEAAIQNFFDISKWDMGQPFYISNFIKVIENVSGVKYVDLFNPTDNVLANGLIIDSDTVSVQYQIAVNEIIVEGSSTINYYYEKVTR
jgi:uncharacterized phage protein gp47/JayE